MYAVIWNKEYSMADNYELFGHRIVVHHQLTFEQQIRDVFVEEIHNGRWGVGARLPGILALAKESGFGTKTMYNAFEKLREDGYVEMRGNRGTFLKSLSPSRKAKGKIGVLLREDQRSQQLILWYEHIILEAAGKRDMITEVKVLPSNMPPENAFLRGALFGDEVKGVISLSAFDSHLLFAGSSPTIPHVFLCPPFEKCVPRVCADVEYAYYELTHRMAAAGHLRIAFSYESHEMDARQAEMHLRGYRSAMEELGMPIDEELIDVSRSLNNENLVEVSDYLKQIIGLPEKKMPTAMVCGSLGRTTVLTNVAPLCGVAIPDQLSVASIGTAAVAGKRDALMSGMLPDFDKMMDACFDVLEEYAWEGGVSKTETLMLFKFIPGTTMKERDGIHLEAKVDCGLETNHSIAPMSEAVHY